MMTWVLHLLSSERTGWIAHCTDQSPQQLLPQTLRQATAAMTRQRPAALALVALHPQALSHQTRNQQSCRCSRVEWQRSPAQRWLAGLKLKLPLALQSRWASLPGRLSSTCAPAAGRVCMMLSSPLQARVLKPRSRRGLQCALLRGRSDALMLMRQRPQLQLCLLLLQLQVALQTDAAALQPLHRLR